MEDEELHIPTRSLSVFIKPMSEKFLGYAEIVAELNRLDHVCRYRRRYADAHLRVTDEYHEWEITREEAEKKLEFLRKLRGKGK